MIRSRLVGLAIVTACLLVTRPAGAIPVGSVFSGSASADPAVAYWNPAAMTLLPGTTALIYGAINTVRVNYQRATPNPIDGLPYPLATLNVAAPRPAVALITDFGLKDFRFGVGMGIPYVDGAAWKGDYEGKPSSTRYHGLNPVTGELTITLSAAYRLVPEVSLAVGLDINGVLVSHHYMVDFGARVNEITCQRAGGGACPLDAPLPREDPRYQGRVDINGFGWGVGLVAGLLVEPWRWLRIGLGFHSNSGAVTVPGDMKVAIPNSVVDIVNSTLPGITIPPLQAKGDIRISTPPIASLGISTQITPRLEAGFDMHWMNTSATQVILGKILRSNSTLFNDVVLAKGRVDFFTLRWRAQYAALPNLIPALALEYSSNTRPEAFVTPTSVDFHRISLQAALAWQVTPWLRIMGEYSHYFLIPRTIRVSAFAPNPNPMTPEEQGFDLPSPTGQYWGWADGFGIGAQFSF